MFDFETEEDKTNNDNDNNSNKRKRSDDDHEDLPKTVKLNVGGKHFEVSRSLIAKDDEDDEEDTFLSRLVSDTWHRDPESEIFIDRDGDRFIYVLDYLRYGEVMLPKTISMDAFMKDMDFYGIVVQEGSVGRENNALEMLLDIKSQLMNKREKFEEEKKRFEELENKMKSAEDEYQKEHRNFVLATSIVRRYEIRVAESKKKYCETIRFDINSNIMRVNSKGYNLEEYEEDMLQKYLNSSGLKFTGWASEGQLRVGKL